MDPQLVGRPDDIHIATKGAPDDGWPKTMPIFGFAIGGLCIIVVLVGGWVLQRVGAPVQLLAGGGIAVATVGLGFAVWAITRAVRRRRLRNDKSAPVSDPTHRLRAIGIPPKLARVTDALENVSFEPVVYRTVHGVEYAKLNKDGAVDTKKTRKGLVIRTEESKRTGDRWTNGLSIALGIIIVVAIHFTVTGYSRKSAPNYFEIMGGVALGMGIAAFLRPTYIRVAPGVLDIFRYGFLGSGVPDVERYDLRTARILIDTEERLIRIEDTAAPKPRIAFIRANRLLGGDLPERAILMAAFSTHPTPEMPQDELGA